MSALNRRGRSVAFPPFVRRGPSYKQGDAPGVRPLAPLALGEVRTVLLDPSGGMVVYMRASRVRCQVPYRDSEGPPVEQGGGSFTVRGRAGSVPSVADLEEAQ